MSAAPPCRRSCRSCWLGHCSARRCCESPASESARVSSGPRFATTGMWLVVPRPRTCRSPQPEACSIRWCAITSRRSEPRPPASTNGTACRDSSRRSFEGSCAVGFSPEGSRAFTVSAEAAREAVRRRSQIQHHSSTVGPQDRCDGSPGHRVQSVALFTCAARAGRDRLAGVLSSPEDAILKKMEFFKAGGSDKHLRDIAGVLKMSGQEIDRPYIEQ
jgi:hypothetical protein